MSLYQQAQSPIGPHRRDAPSYESYPSVWDAARQAGYPPQAAQTFQMQPRHESRPDPPPTYWDEEGSDSDVSRTTDIREPVNRIISPVAAPRQLPQLASPRILNSLDDVQARLEELERVEDHNSQKLKRLEAKRKRKDDRIARRRAMEDEKIRSVLDARVRKDERIRARRQREDEAFRGADKQLGVEELDLRRRLRSLKRGLPVEEARLDGGGASAASMSPPLPHFHGGPPLKRHQSGPPGQNESPVVPSAPPAQSSASAYHFYPPPSTPYPMYFHSGPQIPHSQYHGPPQTLHSSTSAVLAGSPRPGSMPVEAMPPKTNGFSSAGSVPPPSSGPIDTRPPASAPAHNQTAPSYDTRPPPPTTGFTSVNAGQAQPSGFSTVNARPTYAASPSLKPAKERSTPKSEGHRRASGKSPKNTTPITVGGLLLNKRTPSTTHPYQMSEAFANRHHHCERTDELNRGIWTSYGYMGSRDVPTGPPVEMYLRCNHDDCRRIDWRTVHGLQCHIVKNHEQPKGTIGSLEKALAIYGVPLSEIVLYEKTHGLGSAGQMADPKNQKIRNKTKEAMQNSESPASADLSTPTLTPSASYTSNVVPYSGTPLPQLPSRGMSSEHKAVLNDFGASKDMADSSGFQASTSEAPPRLNSFVAVRNTWSTYVPATAPTRSQEKDSPRPSTAQSPVLLSQIDPPKVVQAETLLNADVPSTSMSVVGAAIESPKPTTKAEPAAQVNPPEDGPIESKASLVESNEPAPTTISQPEAPKNEEKTEASHILVVANPTPPQIDKEVAPQEPAVDSAEPELLETIHVAELNEPTPSTPGRRPGRRESATLPKSAQKEPDVTNMQSPKTSKAENKRTGRRTSVAVSTASVSANVSIDGDGEKSGDDAERGGERESGKTSGVRRNATGRFLRKGRHG